MIEKKCKHCEITLTSEIRAGKRLVCRPCRSKETMAWVDQNRERRNKTVNSWTRKIGRVKEYPCITCETLCFKVYAHAFCSIKCRFVSYIKKMKDCWIWVGGKSKKGYGKFMMNNKLFVASRASYIIFKGPIQEGKLICHTCDNPPCVNPDHLWEGTNSENQIDSIKKGRRKSLHKLGLS